MSFGKVPPSGRLAPRAVPGAGAGRGGPARRPAGRPPWNPNFAEDQPGAPNPGGGVAAALKQPSADGYVHESLQSTLPRFRKTVHVGDRIRDKHSGRTGTCLYVGPADFARGKEVCGLRLDVKRSTTDCDGKYRGERYFRCTPGHGLYIPLEDAEFLAVASDAEIDAAGAAPVPARRGPSIPRDNMPVGGRGSRESESVAAEAEAEEEAANFDLESELERVIGLEAVKTMLRSIQNSLAVQKRRANLGVKDQRTMHMLFLGNPGTGKTTVARLVARMLKSLGVLKTGQLIEVTRKDLIGSHHGETAQLTSDAVKRAVGGVLFIDEAYALRHEGSSDSAGQECVNTLVKESEDRAGEVVIILAGYSKEMATFLSTNSGLTSRFPNVFAFADYTPAELAKIVTEVTHSKGFSLVDSLEGARLESLVARLIKPIDIPKGNGRLARNLVERAISRQTDRIFVVIKEAGTVAQGALTMLSEEDFEVPAVDVDGTESVAVALDQLDAVVGLKGVKTYVKQLVAQIQLNVQRREAGMKASPDASLHMIFVGNPGTGKTMVARILAQVLKAMGLLRLGHLVEVDRSGLVAGYAGQTAIKTRQLVESALGGLLFVDEAYAIVADERDHFGKEALDTLIKCTEDFRDDLVVILAGYSEEMKRLSTSNPGVKSRFPTTIEFSDYTSEELMQITDGLLKNEQLELSPGAREVLVGIYKTMARTHDRENGNGRAVRNLLERAKREQALRLMALSGKKSKEQLMLLVEEDFAGALAEMDGDD